MDFFRQIENAAEEKGTLLCIGLDPAFTIKAGDDPEAALFNFNLRVIEQTHPYALCYKPNIAFYERWGAAGYGALLKTMQAVPADIPVIIDAKRGDIGHTAQAYAEAVFGHFKAHAVTLNPYLGRESVEPFLAWKGKGLFILCRTSNPGSAKIQLIEVKGDATRPPAPLFTQLAAEAAGWGENIGLVVAGNDPAALRAVRRLLPQMWLLAPGIGAQGGSVEDALSHGARADGKGILPVVARQIAEEDHPGESAQRFRDAIRASQRKISSAGFSASETEKKDRQELIHKLIDGGCFKTGKFLLKSGQTSPFYLDLRKLISDPSLLKLAAETYLELLRPLSYDRLSAIPVASLPVVAVASLLSGTPMIYPRLPVKDHGSGASIDGDYRAGDKIALLDDLVTTGLSKFEALDVLRRAGLVVEDLVVLVVRGRTAEKDLAVRGVRLHYAFSMDDIIDVLEKEGKTDAALIKEIRDYLKSTDADGKGR